MSDIERKATNEQLQTGSFALDAIPSGVVIADASGEGDGRPDDQIRPPMQRQHRPVDRGLLQGRQRGLQLQQGCRLTLQTNVRNTGMTVCWGKVRLVIAECGHAQRQPPAADNARLRGLGAVFSGAGSLYAVPAHQVQHIPQTVDTEIQTMIVRQA